MARKLNPTNLPRPEEVAPETLNRRSHPTASTLVLMQLRAQELKITPPASIRLEISAEDATEDDAQPVKIVLIDGKK
ncbi:MAG TPA: hypothetical protein VH280_09585 [Verrucomicrobiae bacterium]|jgi:hypothetical protein|nr:hypothetical protein [Verrucomicrobiae bacterium]